MSKGLSSFTFTATCPNDGQEFQVNQIRQMSSREQRAFLYCSHCNKHSVIVVQLVGVLPDKVTGCGTNAGYKEHKLNGTMPCEPCKEAHTAMWASRQRTPVK